MKVIVLHPSLKNPMVMKIVKKIVSMQISRTGWTLGISMIQKITKARKKEEDDQKGQKIRKPL